MPRFRDKTLGGRRPAGDIICIIPPAPPPKPAGLCGGGAGPLGGRAGPGPIFSLPFPPSTMSFPCSFSST